MLQKLHDSLQTGTTAALTQTAIMGLGGVGKTQLALEYAYRYASDYSGIWWVRAEEAVTLAQDYAELGPPLGIEIKVDQGQTIREVQKQLSHCQGFLLIFDNATDPNSIESYLPTGAGTRAIVTTRAQAWPGALGQDVEELPLAAAIDLLCKRTGQNDPKAAEDIANRLGCLPLAIDQAAAYLQACKTTLSKYSTLLEQHGLELLERGQAYQSKQTVGTTWAMALEQLQASCPAAADLLKFCAFLAPEAIHVSALAEAKEHLPAALANVVSDELLLNDAKIELLKYSLIRTDGEAISIHRLVQEVIRTRLTPKESDQWLKAALRAVNGLFPQESHDVRTWPVCSRWLAHGLALANWERADDLDAGACSRLVDRCAGYLKSRADYGAAEPLFRRALGIDEKSLGPNHPELAIRLNHLALLLSDTNRRAEAEVLFRRALDIDERSLGPNHPEVAICLNNLAKLLRETSRLAEAEPLVRRALDIDERSLGPNHPEVAICLNNLANLLREANRLAEAEPLIRRALGIDEKSLGPNHPSVAVRLNNLALLYSKANRHAEAEPLFRRALGIDEKSLGPNHPNVAFRLWGLGALLRDTNRSTEAEPPLRRALAIFEASLGLENPWTVKCRAHLEKLLRAKT
jgi:tetratricopeptide (TPR) repeat protein